MHLSTYSHNGYIPIPTSPIVPFFEPEESTDIVIPSNRGSVGSRSEAKLIEAIIIEVSAHPVFTYTLVLSAVELVS